MIAWMDAWLRSLEDLLTTGGVIMLPLMAICLLIWLLVAERLFFFRRLRRRMKRQTARADTRSEHRPNEGAMALLAVEFKNRRGSNHAMDRMILHEAALALSGHLTDRLALIGVLVAIAPLLGLLGTVTGMMTTFDVLAIFGTGNARAMAGGISEALITTQTGLLVAIPGLAMKVLLDRKAHGLHQEITAAGYYLGRQLDLGNDEHLSVQGD
ncbi:TolQ2 [Desulfosarcina cetonica]|uniref:MotA/TolQ/ExbB proton channel family protein n=1 Tax=Desulfosarcina cetonica TaxID=90730 RepID=UPI0006D144AD|nr:MotA/TolQ/ExbB proton channel family protein [Desulfosarcina cetonica]VTR71095.1 TolQ2 [Desulfosarcina cetonica]